MHTQSLSLQVLLDSFVNHMLNISTFRYIMINKKIKNVLIMNMWKLVFAMIDHTNYWSFNNKLIFSVNLWLSFLIALIWFSSLCTLPIFKSSIFAVKLSKQWTQILFFWYLMNKFFICHVKYHWLFILDLPWICILCHLVLLMILQIIQTLFAFKCNW